MAVRNVEDLNIDEITEETLTEQMLEMGTALGVDTREGSVYGDASAGHIIRTAEFYNMLSDFFDIFSIFTCTGEILDECLKVKGMSRDPSEASSATYKCFFVGANPNVGDIMIVDEYEFTVVSQDDDDTTCWYIKSVETGTDMNYFASGTAVIPDEDIDDLESCTLGILTEAAVDIEEDDSARARFLSAVSEDVEAGNAAQIRKWCTSVEGIGRAELFPLEDGPSTCVGYLISTAGGVPSSSLVAAVQAYVDPGGNGEGEGMATIGLKFHAKAATAFEITITGTVTYAHGADVEVISAAVNTNIVNYLKDRALKGTNTPVTDTRQISINTVGYNILAVDGVLDYEDLELNDQTGNLSYIRKQVPVLSSLDLTYVEES